MEDISRRNLIAAAGGLAAASVSTSLAASPFPPIPDDADPQQIAQLGSYWDAVAARYDVTREVIQLENGYWGMMARPVHDAHIRHVSMVNRQNSYYARRNYGRDLGEVVTAIATTLGVDRSEIALTRGATEALQNLIGGYNKLKPGDAVLYADLDYDSMQTAMEWLRTRRGVDVIKINLPDFASHQLLIDTYEQALKLHPKVRMMLLTHLSHRTGLVLPVKDIAAMARTYNVDVIVDAAHSWGQIDFKARDLGVDFIGFNLHKWIGAPIGVGLMYIAKDRIGDIDRYMGDTDYPEDDIRGRVHTGTSDFAAYLTVPEALAFHNAVGPANKEARLRYLRTIWVNEVRGLPNIQILTPDDARLHAGITSFRITGRTSREDNVAIARELLERFNIFTVHRTGVAAGACVRVTPALFTRDEDMLSLVAALRALERLFSRR